MNYSRRDRMTSVNTGDTQYEVMNEERHLQEPMRVAELFKHIGRVLAESTTLDAIAQECSEGLVRYFDAAFARIWTFNSNENMLELRGSAGMYTHLDGSHRRVPLGALEVGVIAAERRSHLTNSVVGDPRVSDQEWAVREGMVAFAGYPLLVAERVVGVVAIFARHALTPFVFDAMASVATSIAIGIDRKQGEQAYLRLLQPEQQARQVAEVAQERLSSILDHLTDGLMIFDQEWHYRYINPQAEPFAGKPREYLLGKNVWEEFPTLVDSTFYKQYYHAVVAQEPVAFRVFSALLQHWFDVRAYPIADGLVVYFREITQTVNAENEKQQLLEATQQARLEAEHAQQRVTSILESITDAFYTLDWNWKFTYLNRQTEPLLQRRREDLLGKNLWEEFPEAVGSTFYEQYHIALSQQLPVSLEDFYAPLDTWLEIRVYPSPDGLSVYLHNINERKEAEREREHLLQMEQQAHLEAEAALSVHNTFLSSVTHDLKTPLAAIKANLQLVQRRTKREPSKGNKWVTERLEAMERAITKMTGMIDDLLDLSRVKVSQPQEERFILLDILPIIQVAVTEQQATTRRHTLLLAVSGEPLPVYGNATRLDRVVTNLLGNAIKYSPGGGDITIVVTKEQEDGRAWAQMVLTDQGIGIPAFDLPHIFTPFQRASNVTDRIQGTGIGLASVAQVIEQHKGTIMVTSEEGQGSRFTIRIPLVSENVSVEEIKKRDNASI